jgi:hypothetical protein
MLFVDTRIQPGLQAQLTTKIAIIPIPRLFCRSIQRALGSAFTGRVARILAFWETNARTKYAVRRGA